MLEELGIYLLFEFLEAYKKSSFELEYILKKQISENNLECIVAIKAEEGKEKTILKKQDK